MLFLLFKVKVTKELYITELNRILAQQIPYYLCEKWDNSGIQIGDNSISIKKILLALNPSSETISYAVKNKFQAVLTHHPLLFKEIKSLSSDLWPGKVIFQAIKSGISILSLHTNLDKVNWGVSVAIANKLNFPFDKPIIEDGDWGLGVIGNFTKGKKIGEL